MIIQNTGTSDAAEAIPAECGLTIPGADSQLSEETSAELDTGLDLRSPRS